MITGSQPQMQKQSGAEMEAIPNEVQRLKRWLAQEKATLAAAGVITIVGEYSGSGDEGNSNGAFVLGPNGFPAKYQLPQEIEELIEEVINLVATPGYEINEGGGGSITLDVEAGSIVHASYYHTVAELPEVSY